MAEKVSQGNQVVFENHDIIPRTSKNQIGKVDITEKSMSNGVGHAGNSNYIVSLKSKEGFSNSNEIFVPQNTDSGSVEIFTQNLWALVLKWALK